MADKKISELIEALNLKDTDILVIVQDNTTKKITVANAKEKLKGEDGAQGPQGVPGQPGEKGDPGTAGKDGISITSVEMGTVTEEDGYTITSLIIHKSDDSQDTVTVKGKNGKDGQQGPAGADGEDGINGSKIYSSTLSPNNFTEGVDGDWYLRTNTYTLYEKVNGEWISRCNLKGADGTNGTDGADGIDGQSVTCIKVSSEEEAIAQSTANPNNIYYW